jgi:hypothetical protein
LAAGRPIAIESNVCAVLRTPRSAHGHGHSARHWYYRAVVERRIDLSNVDLDVAAEEIAARQPTWVAAGLSVDPPTWMDNDVPWPAPIATNRADVVRPRSLGLHVRRGDDIEAEIVLYAVGWADAAWVHFRSGAEPVQEYVEVDSADQFGPLLDRIVANLLANL